MSRSFTDVHSSLLPGRNVRPTGFLMPDANTRRLPPSGFISRIVERGDGSTSTFDDEPTETYSLV